MTAYPKPPNTDWKMNMKKKEFFPPYPRILADSKKHGGMFTYNLGGRKMTVLTDVETYPIIFAPENFGKKNDDPRMKNVGDAIRMEMDKVGHAWFGIPKDILVHQREGLDSLRKKVLNPTACRPLNDYIGADMARQFASLPSKGECSLVDIACATFRGVNASLFGEGTVPAKAEEDFFGFDEEVAGATLGLPKKPKYWEHHKRITGFFSDSIQKGVSQARCPGIAARLAPVPEGKFSVEDRAKFMVSLFWAPQANTLPMTFWTLAHVIQNPAWRERVYREATAMRLGEGGKYKVLLTDKTCLPFTRACVAETLRLYIANLTIRKCNRDVELTLSTGQNYTLPKNHMVILTSYTTHYDEKYFPNPTVFDPERWLDKDGNYNANKYPNNIFIPFGKGRYQCSGKHLADLEIPTLVALFLKEFDAELLGPLPEPDWDYVVASVRPKGWPHNFNLNVRYSRRGAAGAKL